MIFNTVYKKSQGMVTINDKSRPDYIDMWLTIDKGGGTLSLKNGDTQFTISLEQLYPYVSKSRKTNKEFKGFKQV